MTEPITTKYGPRVPAALKYAAIAHNRQARKGKTEPYLTHLLLTTALALRYCDPADPDRDAIVAAAALHDTAEDQGGEPRLTDIEATFGSRVAEIVRACSDSLVVDGPKLPWVERKTHHLESLQALDDRGVALVTLCDKCANLTDLLADIDHRLASGGSVDDEFTRFNTKAEGTAHYYRAMSRILTYNLTSGKPKEGAEHFATLTEKLLKAVGIPEETLHDGSDILAQFRKGLPD